MSSLSEQIAQETWEMMFRMLGISTGIAADVIAAGGETIDLTQKALENLIDQIRKKNEENKTGPINEDGTVALQDLMKKVSKDNAKLLSMPVADEDVSLLREQFKKQGMTFAIYDVGFDDIQLFLFADTESRKAELAVMQAQAERGLLSDINPDMFFSNLASENIGTISGLSNVELELFRYHAKHNGLMFTSIADNGANTIIFNLETSDVAKKTIADVLWDGVGDEGALIRTQIAHKISNRQAVNLAFIDGEREYYIVNGNHPENYIHITANDFEYYKKSQKVFDVSRSSAGFMDRAIQAVNGYETPVLISKEVFEHSNAEELAHHIELSVQNSMSNEILQKAIDKQMQKRILIEDKMALDDENQGSFWLFDDSISYSEGSTNETFNDLDDNQRETVQNLRAKAEQFVFNEYRADDRSLDNLIAKAEQQRNRGYRYADEPEQLI